MEDGRFRSFLKNQFLVMKLTNVSGSADGWILHLGMWLESKGQKAMKPGMQLMEAVLSPISVLQSPCRDKAVFPSLSASWLQWFSTVVHGGEESPIDKT